MKTKLLLAALISLLPVCASATYPVNDYTANITLNALKGLNDQQVRLLGRILSENQSQLATLKAINQALGGSGGGPSFSSFSAETFSGGAAPTSFGGWGSAAPTSSLGSSGAAAPSGGTPLNINPSSGQVAGGVLQGGAGILRDGGLNARNTGTLAGAVTGNQTVGSSTRSGIDSVARGVGYANNPGGLSANNAASVLSGIPGMGDTVNTVRSSLPQNDYLSMFMGMSVNDFKRAFASPSSFVSSSIMNKVLGDVGKATGAAPEIMYAARVASMTSEQRSNNRTRIAADIADMLGARVLAGVEENAKKSEKFAMDAKVSEDKARAADNLNARFAAANEQSAIANQLLIEAAKQQALSDAAAAGAQAAQAEATTVQEKRLRTEQNFRNK